MRTKADEEENARRDGEDERRGNEMGLGSRGLKGSVNWGAVGEEGEPTKRWVGIGERVLDWGGGGGEDASTITLHVTEHTLTVRLEARYSRQPASNL